MTLATHPDTAAGTPVGTGAEAARELLGLMRRRHSARMAFDPDRPVPADHLRLVLEAARWAPTAHNMQNYEVIVVDDPERLDQIAGIRSEVSLDFIRENFEQLSFSEEELLRKKRGILARMFPLSWLTSDPNPFETADPEHAFLGNAIQRAPVLLLVLHDTTTRAPASEGDVLGMISLGCVMENMWLMAEELGISLQILSVLSGGDVEGDLHRVLGIPHELKVAFGARLGYPPGPAPEAPRVRREVGDFLHCNAFCRTLT
jgi:nitroreductase